MKRILAILAIVTALVVGSVTASGAAEAKVPTATTITYNVDPGGGQITSFFYIARVYIYYNGY